MALNQKKMLVKWKVWEDGNICLSGCGTDNMRNLVVILRCGNHVKFD